MMVPTIHLNGTSRQQLLDDVLAARAALATAIQKLGQTFPNGRDYYPQGNDAQQKAAAEYNERYARLKSVQDELGELAEAIDTAPGRR